MGALDQKMEPKITFRRATLEDAKRLLEWRNDPETRRQSINTDEVTWDAHIKWLEKSLANPSRTLLIAMLGEEPVGTVRLDSGEPRSEISWTVAPSARGRGLGTRIVEEALKIFNRPLRARIKPGNPASIKIAERVGFKKDSQGRGITEWIYSP
ncbi:MAG: N-acetyltransferase GCN5 [Parcubacteria group bacterium Gr01-1014_107]|nr:MAG: N-acetyltransferase GCN5 [Parcubacteria group bacterium Gr01-1014_107]